MGLHIIIGFNFFQEIDYLFTNRWKVYGYSFPYKIFFNIVVSMNQEVPHISNLPPLHIRMSLTELERQHICRLTYNHNVVDNGMVRLLIGKECLLFSSIHILEYRVYGLQNILQAFRIITLLSHK